MTQQNRQGWPLVVLCSYYSFDTGQDKQSGHYAQKYLKEIGQMIQMQLYIEKKKFNTLFYQ